MANNISVTITSLKKALIERISDTEDAALLHQIKYLLDAEEAIIELSDDLQSDLLEASAEAKKGLVISKSSLDAKVEQWLKS
jgi:ATP-dependent protease HslVU (ClpYQ) ATPase subunit